MLRCSYLDTCTPGPVTVLVRLSQLSGRWSRSAHIKQNAVKQWGKNTSVAIYLGVEVGLLSHHLK